MLAVDRKTVRLTHWAPGNVSKNSNNTGRGNVVYRNHCQAAPMVTLTMNNEQADRDRDRDREGEEVFSLENKQRVPQLPSSDLRGPEPPNP